MNTNTNQSENAATAEKIKMDIGSAYPMAQEQMRPMRGRNLINGLQSSLSRAITLGQYTVYYNEPNLINERLNKVAAVTKEDVQRVAKQYIVDTNRTVVITMPKAKAKPATGASGQ